MGKYIMNCLDLLLEHYLSPLLGFNIRSLTRKRSLHLHHISMTYLFLEDTFALELRHPSFLEMLGHDYFTVRDIAKIVTSIAR